MLFVEKLKEVCWGATVVLGLDCVPIKEGGLGLKRIEERNKAAVLKHNWNLFVQAGSLCVTWVHYNILKGKSFLVVRVPQ